MAPRRTLPAALSTQRGMIADGSDFADAAFRAATLHNVNQTKLEALYDATPADSDTRAKDAAWAKHLEDVEARAKVADAAELPRTGPDYRVRSITTGAEARLHNQQQRNCTAGVKYDLARANRLELLASLLNIADHAESQGMGPGVEAAALLIMEEAIKRFQASTRATALMDASNAIQALR